MTEIVSILEISPEYLTATAAGLVNTTGDSVMALLRKLRITRLLRGILPLGVRRQIEHLRTRIKVGRGMRFVPEQELSKRYREAVDLLDANAGDQPAGDYLEFGVYNGTSLACMDQVLKDAGNREMRMFGFDSFEGLPASAEQDDDGAWYAGQFASSLSFTKRFLKSQNVDMDRTILVKGFYSDTLNPKLIEKHDLTKAAIILIDCDMYLSAKEALDFCGPLIHDEAIIFFDDWYSLDLDKKNLGEKKAFDEFLEENPQFQTEEFPAYNENSRAFRVIRKMPRE